MFPNFFSWTFAHSDMLSLVHQCMFCKIDIITVFNLIWNSGIFSLLLSTGNTFESTALKVFLSTKNMSALFNKTLVSLMDKKGLCILQN